MLRKVMKIIDAKDFRWTFDANYAFNKNTIKSLPDGLDTKVYSEGKKINSSIIQKILLARCIISAPKILYLEEPLENIDSQSAKEIIDFLTAEDQNWTIVVVSKNEYWKQKCSKHYNLENGVIQPIK